MITLKKEVRTRKKLQPIGKTQVHQRFMVTPSPWPFDELRVQGEGTALPFQWG
jgi:hypothetical protein